MKELVDGKNVTSRSWYFLLDWNERDEWKFMSEKFNKTRLWSLELDEYMILWLNATTSEHNDMCKKTK